MRVRAVGLAILLSAGVGLALPATHAAAQSAAAAQDTHAGARAITDSADAPPLDELLLPTVSELAGLVSRFTSDRNVLLRFHDIESAARRARLADFYNSWQSRLDQVPFDTLQLEARIDYVLLRNRLRYQLRRLDIEGRLDSEVQPLLPFDTALVRLHESRRRLEPMDARHAAATLDKAAKMVRATRAAVERGLDNTANNRAPGSGRADVALQTTPVVANRAVERIQQLRRTLDGWYRFFDGYDPAFSWWVRAPYRRFVDDVDDYAVFLRERVIGADDDDGDIIGDPLGREALLLDLEMEMIPYTPEELIDIAHRELEWGEAQQVLAARELGFGDDVHAALEYVKTLHVAPGEQPELVRHLAREAEDIVAQRGLVSVPDMAREIWRMEMLSPEVQRIAPFFFGGEVVQVAYPTDGMTHAEKVMSMRANNRHFSRNAVQHEVIPGHHLQGYMTDRYSVHRRAFTTPFWQEGWALYWEMLLWDLDFPQSPEDRIGMLFWRNHRAARIIFSLSFHLGEMTPAQAIDFLVDRVGHERGSATAEVRRSFLGTYSPLYQVAYMIGGLQFRALRRDLVEQGQMSDREFHDHILRRGSMPVEMVRASLLGEPPARDFVAGWRFDAEPRPR